jgi:DNA-binding Xre family transcriptional regulator
MEINIGHIVSTYLEQKRIRRAALSRKMSIQISSLLRLQKRDSIQTKTLLEITNHLKHNFFMDIALMLPPDYTTTTDPFAQKNQRIAELEAENLALKTKNELLIELMKK